MLTGYYQKTKERLSKKACERYQNLSEQEKEKKSQYACERYRNLSEEEKEKKRQYVLEQYKKILDDIKLSYNTKIWFLEFLLSASRYSTK